MRLLLLLPLLTSAFGLVCLAGCGAAPRPAPVPAGALAALGRSTDTASTRAIKKAIKVHFEAGGTLQRIVLVQDVRITPASAWNEFAFEAIVDEDELDAGRFTSSYFGVYDAVTKGVTVTKQEILAVYQPDDRDLRLQ